MRHRRTSVGPGGGFGYPAYGDGAPQLASPIPANIDKPAASAPLLRVGSRGPAVRDMQRAVGTAVDGIFGPKTRAAVQAFQRRHRLAVDGIVGPQTWAAIRRGPKPAPGASSSSVPAFPGTVRRGSRGQAVRAVQFRLRARGWRVAVDGVYGADTEAIVRAFQREKHLTADGISGPATWRALWTAPIT
jgi:peptidoglycan hydrolase-like protein with peptidoglycan-binding domain